MLAPHLLSLLEFEVVGVGINVAMLDEGVLLGQSSFMPLRILLLFVEGGHEFRDFACVQ